MAAYNEEIAKSAQKFSNSSAKAGVAISSNDWQEAFKNSLINHRAPYLSFIAWALNIEVNLIAEIGVNKGETSKLFRHLFPQARLFLIDPWQLTMDYL